MLIQVGKLKTHLPVLQKGKFAYPILLFVNPAQKSAVEPPLDRFKKEEATSFVATTVGEVKWRS